ncbi:hypothetical protein L1987_42374 [Smallanthus sonchifolius]|uniref:Uncharacterized protein n=1 Tax=Smallanthus sonchifolius TaxID=185202 RepID=A0ACB9GKM8_9ASTR|nr:hypothetical protein L1987_42374 [Smallanthus sonchifolius]
MATPVKVYGPPLSTAVSRVLVCLLEKDVPFQLVPVSMAKMEHKKPDYIKMQPFGQVPAFQDDDITLFDNVSCHVFACSNFDGSRLKWDIFLKETDQDSRESGS